MSLNVTIMHAWYRNTDQLPHTSLAIGCGVNSRRMRSAVYRAPLAACYCAVETLLSSTLQTDRFTGGRSQDGGCGGAKMAC